MPTSREESEVPQDLETLRMTAAFKKALELHEKQLDLKRQDAITWAWVAFAVVTILSLLASVYILDPLSHSPY